MKTKEIILCEAIEIYNAIVHIMKEHNTDYCQSWWLNCKNFKLSSGLDTPTINTRCRLLIREGYLVRDDKNTSTSMGISYKLTDKKP